MQKMRRRNLIMGATAAVALGACSSPRKLKRYDGPEVTFVVVNKAPRTMHLVSRNRILTSYDINLGFDPVGHKQFEGDGRTPEGLYQIDRRNPKSDYHLSLGMSYPNEQDIQFAQSMGKSPGGNIFIHGQKERGKPDDKDWTWGCIAVTNKEIEEIYMMVRTGTPIQVNA
jgi:murein L,D-transpeptidase YafK